MEPQIQRWSAKRKVELLLGLIKGENLVDVCREYDRKPAEVESWMDAFMKAGGRNKADFLDQELTQVRAKVGDLVLEIHAGTKWAAGSTSHACESLTELERG